VWRRWHKEQPEPPDDPLSGVNDETVNALLAGVQRLMTSEESRGESLNGRASGVTGFIALIVSVAAALSRVPTGTVHGTTRTVALLVFLGSVGAFLVALWMAIFKVLRPSPGLTIADNEVQQYPTYAWIKRRPVEVQGHLMKAVIETLNSERARNDGKARWLNRAYVALLVGVICLAGDGLILLHDAGSRGDSPPQHAPARATGGGASTAQRLSVLRPRDGGDSARA
jgi:hypothetical protein